MKQFLTTLSKFLGHSCANEKQKVKSKSSRNNRSDSGSDRFYLIFWTYRGLMESYDTKRQGKFDIFPIICKKSKAKAKAKVY